MEATTVFSRFLPETTALQLNSWHLDNTATLLTLHVTSTQQVVPCPVCAVFTPRVHSRYIRTLADLPWGVARVRWQLRVRKFVCTNAQCPRRIFTERLPDVVALWPDREAETLAQWLRAHPGVEVITRDRARAYADGACHGAPEATQVADRFHLRQHLVEALEQVFHTHRAALGAVNDALRCQGVPLVDGTVAVAVPPPPPTGQEKTAQRRARRVECHQQVWALWEQGWPGHAIAAHLSIGKSTVFRYLRTATLPERTRRADQDRSILNPYKPYLLERWNAGYRDALRLYGELPQRGYPGSYPTVARYVQRLRQAQGQVPRSRLSRRSLPVVAEPHHPLLTARQAAWLV